MDVRIGSYGVIVHEGNILLSHWNEHGRSGWSLPGGGVEAGETVQEGALREIEEETGYRAELGRILGVHSLFIPESDRSSGAVGPLHALRIVHEATIVGGELRDEIGGSSDEARWFALDEVPAHRVGLVDIALEMWRGATA